MVTLTDFIDIYVFTTGRRLYTFKQVQAAAAALGLEEIAALAAEAVAYDGETLALERTWQQEQASGDGAYPAEAAGLDARLDATLGAISRVLEQTATVLTGEPELSERARAAHDAVFPRGVTEIVHKTYVEEVELVDAALALLEGPDAPYAGVVAEAGAGRYVAQLRAINTRFRQLIADAAVRTVTWDQVRARRAGGQQLLLRLIALALGQFNDPSDAESAARLDALLGPVKQQNERLRAYYRSHAQVRDIDPGTGAEVEPVIEG